MTIPLVEIDPENAEIWGRWNACYFCSTRCDTWHDNTNNPVCKNCVGTHKVGELPDNGVRVRALKRKAARDRAQKNIAEALQLRQQEIRCEN